MLQASIYCQFSRKAYPDRIRSVVLQFHPQGSPVRFDAILWDLVDDPDGNVQHCADHGISREEVEEVLKSAVDFDVNRSTGRPVAFGETCSGRHLMVVFEQVDAVTVYPITAFEAPRRYRR